MERRILIPVAAAEFAMAGEEESEHEESRGGPGWVFSVSLHLDYVFDFN